MVAFYYHKRAVTFITAPMRPISTIFLHFKRPFSRENSDADRENSDADRENSNADWLPRPSFDFDFDLSLFGMQPSGKTVIGHWKCTHICDFGTSVDYAESCKASRHTSQRRQKSNLANRDCTAAVAVQSDCEKRSVRKSENIPSDENSMSLWPPKGFCLLHRECFQLWFIRRWCFHIRQNGLFGHFSV